MVVLNHPPGRAQEGDAIEAQGEKRRSTAEKEAVLTA
jgi:hypothetical protein